jgi:hypothetical protein
MHKDHMNFGVDQFLRTVYDHLNWNFGLSGLFQVRSCSAFVLGVTLTADDLRRVAALSISQFRVSAN